MIITNETTQKVGNTLYIVKSAPSKNATVNIKTKINNLIRKEINKNL